MSVTIYHNAACGTSRNTLALIRNAGIEPVVVEYLTAPPDRATLASLITDAGLAVREYLARDRRMGRVAAGAAPSLPPGLLEAASCHAPA